MSPTLIITRPLEESNQTVTSLSAIGYDCLIEPILSFSVRTNSKSQVIKSLKENLSAIIITSKRALFTLVKFSINFELPIIIVGQENALYAKKNGFSNIINISQDSIELVNFIISNYNTKGTNFLYLSAAKVSGNIKENLILAGYNIKRLPIYEMTASKELSQQTINKILSQQIHGILFYSQRTAKIFINLLIKHKLISYCKLINIYCLSSNIAKEFDNNYFLKIKYCKFPNHSSMLELINS